MENQFKNFYESLDTEAFKIFNKGEYYLVYNSDIDMLPDYNTKDVTEKKSMKELKILEQGVEEIIRFMLLKKKVPVKEYEEFKLIREGYPGNWNDFTDLLLDKKNVPSLAAVSLSDKISVSFLSTEDCIIRQCSFEDDDLFSNLYAIISEVNIIEIIFDNDKLEPLLNNLGLISHFKKVSVKSKTNEFNSDILKSTDLLCEYLRKDYTDYKIEEYIRPFVCKVDDSTLFSLNLVANEHCVMNTFNCYTNQGYRLLHKFIKQPLIKQEEIEKRLEFVDTFRTLDMRILDKFPDLFRITKRISSFKINLQETLRLCQVIGYLPELINALENKSNLQNDLINPLINIYTNLKPLKTQMENYIDTEAAKRNIYKVRSDVSERLTELDNCLGQLSNDTTEEYDRVCKIYAKTKLDNQNNVFKITRVEYQGLKELFKKSGFLELSFLKGGVTFTTKKLSLINIERDKIKESIYQEEKNIRDTIKNILKEHVSTLEITNYIVAIIDVFNALALKSKLNGYSKPIFTTSDYEIKNAFHPLLEDKGYIPNSLSLKKKRSCVITGPNMGGKSTFLKTCGVIAIMAQIGSYVPAEYCKTPIFDGIYVRIGAGDCVYTGMSTFMVEMSEIARICKLGTEKSLIIIDELGRGTSAIDGLSIATAVKEHIMDKGSISLYATHFPELCTNDVVNKRVKCDGTTLMYELEDGICDTSFGIGVAEKVGFPDEVIIMAKKSMETFD